jgi:hypothetical protein
MNEVPVFIDVSNLRVKVAELQRENQRLARKNTILMLLACDVPVNKISAALHVNADTVRQIRTEIFEFYSSIYGDRVK